MDKVQQPTDIEINDWLSDAAVELREALSAEHCPPPPSLPAVTMASSSQLMNGEHALIANSKKYIVYM